MKAPRILVIACVTAWTAGCGMGDAEAPSNAGEAAATTAGEPPTLEEEYDEDKNVASPGPALPGGTASWEGEPSRAPMGGQMQGIGGLGNVDLAPVEAGEATAEAPKPMAPPEEPEVNRPILLDPEAKAGLKWESTGRETIAQETLSGDDEAAKKPEDAGDGDWRSGSDTTATLSRQDEEQQAATKLTEARDRIILNDQRAEADGKVGKAELKKKDDAEVAARGRLSRRREKAKAALPRLEPSQESRPDRFLPRFLYFENTYLGGDAAYRENLRRVNEALGAEERPHDLATAYPQPFDAPPEAGLALTAELDRSTFEKPGRVFLQVGIQGSRRYGWRRPPLEVVLVLDPPALAAGMEPAVRVIGELLAQLGPQDQLAVVLADAEPRTLAPLGRIRNLRTVLPPVLDGLAPRPAPSAGALASAMKHAGALLQQASTNRTTLPGTQTVLVLASGGATDRVAPATSVAHALTMQGVVTSVIEVDAAPRGEWWAVANAGYGNYHRIEGGDPRTAVKDELDTLSRVVARLVRVNIRLSKNAEGIRILGSRVLDQEEVRRVKAREVAADRNLSKTMGVKADRGDDDDGIQTVIPYFYGGDAHVILVELWVDRPGTVADVTLRYKDMVNLSNATARVSVAMRNVPREDTPEQLVIRRNVRGMAIAESLQHASIRVRHGDPAGALEWLAAARTKAERTSPADRRVVTEFSRLVDERTWTGNPHERELLADSLYLAGRRKVGEPAP